MPKDAPTRPGSFASALALPQPKVGSPNKHWAASCAVIAGLTAGCAASADDLACPAIAYSNTLALTVVSAASTSYESYTLECSQPCGPAGINNSYGATLNEGPLVNNQAALDLFSLPDSVLVAVEDQALQISTEPQRIALSWSRTGGSLECGGPMLARAELSAP